MSDLHYPQEVKMSGKEKQLYEDLLQGIDNQLLQAIEYLDSDECKRLWYDEQLQIDDFWEKANLKKYLDSIIEANVESVEGYIEYFYAVGRELGCEELNEKVKFSDTDAKALFFLKEYNFELVKNVNDEIANGIKKVITEQLATGKHPYDVVPDLMKLPFHPLDTKISVKTRCEYIARTESARALNTGSLQSYEILGVTQVDFITSHTRNVCDICRELEEKSPYSLKEAMSLICPHPNCRCSVAAVTDTIEEPPTKPRIINTTPFS